MKPLIIFLIVLIILIILWMMYHCSLKCGSKKDGYFKNYDLLDNAYGKRQLPTYTQNWDYNLPHDTGHAFINGRAMDPHGFSTEGYTVPQVMKKIKGRYASKEGMSLGAGLQDVISPGAEQLGLVEPMIGECKPFHIYNDYTGQCEPLFQDLTSAAAFRRESPMLKPKTPVLTIPGTTLFGYGVDRDTPDDIPLQKLGVQW